MNGMKLVLVVLGTWLVGVAGVAGYAFSTGGEAAQAGTAGATTEPVQEEVVAERIRVYRPASEPDEDAQEQDDKPDLPTPAEKEPVSEASPPADRQSQYGGHRASASDAGSGAGGEQGHWVQMLVVEGVPELPLAAGRAELASVPEWRVRKGIYSQRELRHWEKTSRFTFVALPARVEVLERAGEFVRVRIEGRVGERAGWTYARFLERRMVSS